MSAEQPGDDEVLAPVPEEERFRRLEELQDEQEPGPHRDEPSGEEPSTQPVSEAED